MYRISLPLINRTVTPETREEYLRQFRRAEVERVFLVPSTDMVLGQINQFESLVDNLAWFEKNGIEAAIWVGASLGHGGLLHDVGSKREERMITTIVNLAGKAIDDTRCPLDPIFRTNMVTVFRQLATSGAKTILIDDDFRLSQRTEEFCCFCFGDLINRVCGVNYVRIRGTRREIILIYGFVFKACQLDEEELLARHSFGK